MQGKKAFTTEEAVEIRRLISEKLQSDGSRQKALRDRIRKIGFYASDFGLRNGYTVEDFNGVAEINGSIGESSVGRLIANKASKGIKAVVPKKSSNRDEFYVMDLCDSFLCQMGSRQHTFDFLKGDSGRRLPVDVFYSRLNIVIEYQETQHHNSVGFFDNRITTSGITRGEQRKKYDRLKQQKLLEYGIKLIAIQYTDFNYNSRHRIIRDHGQDMAMIKRLLGGFL